MAVLPAYNLVAEETSTGIITLTWSEDNPTTPAKTYFPEYKYGLNNNNWVAMTSVAGTTSPSTTGTFQLGQTVGFRVRVQQGGEFSKYSPTIYITLSNADEVSVANAKFQLNGDCTVIRFWDLTGQQPYHFSGYPAGADPNTNYDGKIVILDELGVTELGSFDVDPSQYPAYFRDITLTSIVSGGLEDGAYVIRYEIYDSAGDLITTYQSSLLIACSTFCNLASIGHEVAINNGNSDKSSDFYWLSSLAFHTIPALLHQGDIEDANEVLDYVKTQAQICC